MKAPVILKTETEAYKFKIKYSTICDLKGLGVDLLSGEEDLQSDPEKLRLIFWKGLESGEVKTFSKKDSDAIFDTIMEDIGPEEFAKAIPEALAIKTKPPVKK